MNILSNTVLVLGIILGIALGVAILSYFVLPLLIKKGVPVSQYIQTADEVLNKAEAVMKVVDGLLPNNQAVNIIDKIIEIAEIGTKNAEQLYKIEEIDKTQRKEEAIKYVHTVLEELGIEITPEREQIIDGAIEAAVYAIGHKTESFTEAEINKLMSAPNEDIITDISSSKAVETSSTLENENSNVTTESVKTQTAEN